MNILERFESKVEKGEPGKCWIWHGTRSGPRWKNSSIPGYGKFQLGGKSQSAHRVAFCLYHHEIPHGLHVLHKCDNPLCVNPDHLFLGSHIDNMADKHAKGREVLPPSGELHHKAKLAEFEVRSIRKSPYPKQYLAQTYGVSVCTINDIQKRRSWRHIE